MFLGESVRRATGVQDTEAVTAAKLQLPQAVTQVSRGLEGWYYCMIASPMCCVSGVAQALKGLMKGTKATVLDHGSFQQTLLQ